MKKLKDITGQKFNRLTALGLSEFKKGVNFWNFQCDCGVIKSLQPWFVVKGVVKSCGCIKNEKDITGQKFNQLTAIRSVEKPSHIKKSSNQIFWEFLCDCGKTKILRKGKVTGGLTRSCGCLYQTIKRYNALPSGEASLNSLISEYIKGAKRRGLLFSLSKEEFRKFTKKTCVYCGVEPLQVHTPQKYSSPYVYNGIDRVDSSKGYTIDNSVSCCWFCNNAKQRLSLEEFMAWIKRLIEFQKSKEEDRKLDLEETNAIQ